VADDCKRAASQFPGTEITTLANGKVHAIRYPKHRNWMIIAHPLWDFQDPRGTLLEATLELMKKQEPFVIGDSFNFARRPISMREAVKTS
jgi:hypothetical protein